MNYQRTFVIGAVAALALLTMPVAEAQLLKKISKGLEKINKEMEKVDRALKGQISKDQAITTSLVENPQNGEESGEGNAIAESASADVASQTQYPYLTSETLFLEATPWTLSDVSDGVFSVRRNGNSALGDLYEFCFQQSPHEQQLG